MELRHDVDAIRPGLDLLDQFDGQFYASFCSLFTSLLDTLARLVDAHDIAELVESIFDRSMKSIISGVEGTEESEDDLRKWVHNMVTAPEHRDMGMLWISLREIFRRGEAERALCLELLETLARFAKKRTSAEPGYLGF